MPLPPTRSRHSIGTRALQFAGSGAVCSELIFEFEYPMIEVFYEFKKAGKAVCALSETACSMALRLAGASMHARDVGRAETRVCRI